MTEHDDDEMTPEQAAQRSMGRLSDAAREERVGVPAHRWRWFRLQQQNHIAEGIFAAMKGRHP